MAEDFNISQEDILAALQASLQLEHFTLTSQNLNCNTLKVTLLNHMSNQEQTVQFFIKTSFTKKEHLAYTYFDKFLQYSSTLATCVPKCFNSSTAQHYLILEQIEESQPLAADLLEIDSILVALHALAKLHASSIIYEEACCAQVLVSEQSLEEDPDSILKCFLTEINLFQLPETLSTGKSFYKIARYLYADMSGLLQPSGRYRNVLCHGKVTADKLRFITDGATKTKSCRLIDFSHAKYLPPAHDVLMLIYLTTTKGFRRNFLYELLGIYYNFLEKILKLSDLDIEKIIPFSEFLNSCEEQKTFVVLYAVGVVPLILKGEKLEESDEKDQKDRSELIKENLGDERFMSRVKETFEDLMEECEKYREKLCLNFIDAHV